MLRVKPNQVVLASLLLAILALPIWLYRYVPLIDYPNHLARMEILSFYDRSPHLQDIYIHDRRLLPDLGMDLVVPFLRQHFSLEISGKLFLTGLLLLFCAGTVTLGAAVHGRLTLRALLLWPTFYNSTLLWGFLNYITGVCLFIPWAALLIYAVTHDERRLRVVHYALLLTGAVLCYVAHLTAFALCCVTWGMLVLRSLFLERRVGTPLLLFGTTLIVPLALYAQILAIAGEHSAARPTLTALQWDWLGKITHVGVFTRGYDLHEDVIPTLLLAAAFGYCCIGARTRAWLSVALWPAAGLFAAYLVLPLNANAHTGAFDGRFYWPAWVFLVFALPASGWSAREKVILAVVTFLAYGLRVEALSTNWKALSRTSAEMIAVLDQVPEGARLYPLCGTSTNWDIEKNIRALCHVAEYAIVRRGVIDPGLFTAPGAQPIVYREQLPRYRPQGRTKPSDELAGYDYVWSIEPRAAIREYLNTHAEPVGTAGGFVLWRMKKG